MTVGTFLSTHPLPPFIIALVIAIPSLILYVVEVIVLIKYSSQFKSAFFRLFILRFILNFLNFFCSFVYSRFGLVGFFIGTFRSLPKWFLGICYCYNYYNFHAENLSTFFILLNRLTSVLMPFKHKKIWNFLLPISFFVILTVPLPFTFPMVGLDFFIHLQKDNSTFTLDFPKPYGASALTDLHSLPTLLSAMSAIVFCVICVLLNIATIFVYNVTSRSRMALSDAGRAEQKIELRLTVYAIVTFIAQLFYAICMTLMHVACCVLGEGWDRLFFSAFYQLPWVNDLSHIVVPSWVLLWASEPIRTLAMKELGINKLPFANRSTISVVAPSRYGWMEKLDEANRTGSMTIARQTIERRTIASAKNNVQGIITKSRFKLKL
ncbi:srg family chemoreceptor domain-containing protein [Ditylenchus destructor]|uniref:Serpentine receptor class gamma n=1 Tax=Ditylenchus destructor TaxID=166010 RepID=A0AAD4QTS6_9BILA|nr:srg family chemoreceptor domain-containing protein [Ditylenchus destructor]